MEYVKIPFRLFYETYCLLKKIDISSFDKEQQQEITNINYQLEMKALKLQASGAFAEFREGKTEGEKERAYKNYQRILKKINLLERGVS
ncbi:hypothetical protein LJB89_03900 [Tyzzerella sp. OttesenSCG-928-J15]|nr:hypothetical protein [Tyzzerella sp. OttesenSCG-928-J15]